MIGLEKGWTLGIKEFVHPNNVGDDNPKLIYNRVINHLVWQVKVISIIHL